MREMGIEDDGSLRLPPKEYGEVCHAIRTKYANKIPLKGDILYGNYYYKFNYFYYDEMITFAKKININGNESKIRLWMRKKDERF